MSNAAASADPIAGLLDWEPDDPSRPFSLEALDDAQYLDDERERNGSYSERERNDSYASGDSRRVDPYAAERRARDLAAPRVGATATIEWTVLALTPLGETCAALRGENELGSASLASDALEGLGPEQIAGAGALCCDANRQTSCAYGLSPELDGALEAIEPDAGELMSLQFEAGMDAPVNVSRSVAALVESWGVGGELGPGAKGHEPRRGRRREGVSKDGGTVGASAARQTPPGEDETRREESREPRPATTHHGPHVRRRERCREETSDLDKRRASR